MSKKDAKQKLLLQTTKLVYLGTDPKATGSKIGWLMMNDLYFRCKECGYYMKASTTESDSCYCGKLHKDVDYGRIGFDLGDESIEVYRESD